MADFKAQGKQPEVLFWVGCAGDLKPLVRRRSFDLFFYI